MNKLLLFLCLLLSTSAATAQCNAALSGPNTSVISQDTTIFTSAPWHDSILVCAGATLTYDYTFDYRHFYVRGGGTLIIKNLQAGVVFLESGATLKLDTTGGGLAPVFANIYYDSTNVTLIDTSQILGGTTWTHCLNNTFVYTLFTPAQPCVPLSINDNYLNNALATSFTNPVRDNIVLNQIILEKANEISILDISGKLVKKTNDFYQPINVSYLPKGIYILQVNGKDGNTAVSKFIKD